MTLAAKGAKAEIVVYEKLLAMGFRDVRLCPNKSPYDMEVDGRPVEIKYSSRLKSGGWHFGLSPRERRMPVSAYVLCLDGVPGEDGWVFIVYPGSFSGSAISVGENSLDSLRAKGFIDGWTLLQSEPYPLIPRDLPTKIGKYSGLPLHGDYSHVSVSIRYFCFLKPISVSELAETIGCSEDEVQSVIDGHSKPSALLMYSLGMRIPTGCVKKANERA